MEEDGKSASLIVDSTLDALSDLFALKSTMSENSVIQSRDYIDKLMRMSNAVTFERLYWMCDQYCNLRAVIRGSINPMMDVRLTLIQVSCRAIITAAPVSMTEEIGLLKREVMELKKSWMMPWNQEVSSLRLSLLALGRPLCLISHQKDLPMPGTYRFLSPKVAKLRNMEKNNRQ